MPHSPYSLRIERKPLARSFCAALLCAAAGMGALNFGWKAWQQERQLVWKSESNYYSNQGRLEALLQRGSGQRGQMLFLGSSRTGRIPGAESSSAVPWDCLGLDASNAAEGVRLLLNGTVPPYPVVAVEMESFFEERTQAFAKGAGTAASPFFFRRPLYRLSSLLYSELRHQPAAAEDPWPLLPPPPVSAAEQPACPGGKTEPYITLLQRLQTEHGCRVVPLLLPNRSGHADAAAKAKAAYAAARLGTPLLDLNELLPADAALRFTDHTHLAPESAYGAASAVYHFIFPEN